MDHNIQFYRTGDAICDELLGLLESYANQTLALNNVFRVGISNGTIAEIIAEGLYDLRTDFTKWQIFFCDDCMVPETHPNSTFHPFQQMLLYCPSALRESNFYKINTSLSPREAALDYEHTILKAFQVPLTSKKEVPSFDVLILDIGDDSHTAALFPDHFLLREQTQWMASMEEAPPFPNFPRVTMTLPLLKAAKVRLFGAEGKAKAEMLKRILVDKDSSLPVSMTLTEKNKTSIFIACDEAGSLITTWKNKWY